MHYIGGGGGGPGGVGEGDGICAGGTREGKEGKAMSALTQVFSMARQYAKEIKQDGHHSSAKWLLENIDSAEKELARLRAKNEAADGMAEGVTELRELLSKFTLRHKDESLLLRAEAEEVDRVCTKVDNVLAAYEKAQG